MNIETELIKAFKKIFPMLKKDDAYRLLRLIVILVSLLIAIGIGSWIWDKLQSQPAVNVDTNGGVAAGGDISGNTININSTDNDSAKQSEK